MTDKKPFIIRSDTPHSVEVVPGSLNAKGKKNWVKAGEEDPHAHEAVNEHLDMDAHLESLLSTKESTSSLGTLGYNATSSEDTKIGADSQKDHLEKAGNDQQSSNLQQINDSGKLGNRFLGIDHEAFKDSIQTLEVDPKSKNTGHFDASDSIEDNLAKIAAQRLGENLQKVGLDTGMDNKVKFDVTAPDSNIQKIPGAKGDVNQISLDTKATKDNSQSIPSEASSDNMARIEGTVFDLNQKEKIYSEKLEDHTLSIPADAQEDHKVNLKADSLSNDSIQIDSSSLTTHRVGIESDASEDNRAKIQADMIKDRRAKFDEIRRSRSAPRIDTSQEAIEPEDELTQSRDNTPPTEHLEPLSHQQQIALAQKKKSDEFHGRVEAIKRTVTQLNKQLDGLEENSIELKKVKY